jgi:hypothetical protein
VTEAGVSNIGCTGAVDSVQLQPDRPLFDIVWSHIAMWAAIGADTEVLKFIQYGVQYLPDVIIPPFF